MTYRYVDLTGSILPPQSLSLVIPEVSGGVLLLGSWYSKDTRRYPCAEPVRKYGKSPVCTHFGIHEAEDMILA
jgi:hypothetical protein